MDEVNNIVEKIRKEEIDINNQELFFSILIKGLLMRLDDDIKIRGEAIPHYIINTGDDTMYLEKRGYNHSIEPIKVSNENYIYSQIPRCIVNPGGISLESDQLSSPYSVGYLQYQTDNQLYTLCGEFRRMPIKLTCETKYYVDSYKDLLALVQQIITKLSYIRTFRITYMGQSITCSYRIPDSFDGEAMVEMDGTTTDNKSRTLSLSLEVETALPVWAPQTICKTDKVILHPIANITPRTL